jgi:hypothetical protein
VLVSLRITVGALMASVVVIGLALSFVLVDGGPGGPGEKPPWAVIGGFVVAALVAHLLAVTVGYRVGRASPTTDPLAVFSSRTMLRAVLGQAVAVAGVGAAFVVTSHEMTVFLVAAACSLVVMGVDAFPTRRHVRRTEAALRQAGAPADLGRRLGL